MAINELTVFRGDDKTWTLTVTDASGDAINLTGSTIFFTVKTNKADTDANAVISKDITSHTNPTGGISSITVTDSDTDIDVKHYFYDIQLVDSSGIITTLVVGDFQIKQDITVRIA